MRTIFLLVAAIVLSTVVPASATSSDPFPVGACVRATAVDRRPVCVMVDPTD